MSRTQKEFVLERMREAYREKDAKELKRLYLLSGFMLDDDDRKKISLALSQIDGSSDTINDALKKLGGYLV